MSKFQKQDYSSMPSDLASIFMGQDKKMFGIYGYPPETLSNSEEAAIEAIMFAGLQMKDANKKAAPFHVPPNVALAIYQVLIRLNFGKVT